MRVLGIITARGGSKGLPGKNIRMLSGKPLLAYTIESAKASGVFDRLIISTDDNNIADVAKKYGCEVPFMRPPELALDDTPHLPVVQHAVSYLKEKENYEPDYVMILQPTSPLRRDFHIREAVEQIQTDGADSLVSISAVPLHFHPKWQFTLAKNNILNIFTGEAVADIVKRRQDLDRTYSKNGAIFLFKTGLLFADKPSFYGKKVTGYLMDDKYSVGIDDERDWELAVDAIKKIND